MTAIAPNPLPQHHWQPGVLPEILGYLGAALVVGAGIALVAQSWSTWSALTQIVFVAVAMAALYVTAGVLSLTAGGRRGLAEHTARHRLVAVLATLAAPLTAVVTGLALDAANIDFGRREEMVMLLVFSVGFAAAAFAAWWVPGVVPTLAVSFAAFLWITSFASAFVAPVESPLLEEVTFLVAATGWLVVAPFLLPPRVLTEALAMFGFIVLQMPMGFTGFDTPVGIDPAVEMQMTIGAWISRIALLSFATVALILFARGRSWAWAVGGVIAAGVGAMSIAGQTLGMIAGLLVAGVVLLAASGILIITRTRRERTPTA